VTVQNPLPEAEPGLFYLTEGGAETEIMYGHGFDFPEFAMFTLCSSTAGPVRANRSRFPDLRWTSVEQPDIGQRLAGYGGA
jgi:hypothetical protein